MDKINYKVHIIKEDEAYFPKFKPLKIDEIISIVKNSYDSFIINKKYFSNFEKYEIDYSEFLTAYKKLDIQINDFNILNLDTKDIFLKLDENTFLYVSKFEEKDQIFYYINKRINLKNNSFHIYYFEYSYLTDSIVSIYKHKNLIEIIDAKKTLLIPLIFKYNIIDCTQKSLKKLKQINNLQIFYYKDFFILLKYKKFRENLEIYLKLKNTNSEQAELLKQNIILNREHLIGNSFENFINIELIDFLNILEY